MPTQDANVRPRRTVLYNLWDHNVISIFVCCAIIYWLLHSPRTDQVPQAFPAPPVPLNCDLNEPLRTVAIIGRVVKSGLVSPVS